MRKTINKVRLEGKVYDKSSLTIKTVKDQTSKNFGKEFIGGSLDIATDDDGLNIVTIYFTFVTPTYSSGKKCATYDVLKEIIDSGKTILTDGIDEAQMVSVDGAIEINDFYTSRKGEETLVSPKRVRGSFLNKIRKYSDKRNSFECDMIINGSTLVEADPERNIDEDYLKIKGAVFDFRGAILPVEFCVHDPDGINFFQSLEATANNMTFTKVWGFINSYTIVNKTEVQSAFGAPAVKEYEKPVREWVVNGTYMADKFYEIGDSETGITADEIKKALADREVHLAEVKKKSDEYQASRNSSSGANAASAPAAEGGFNF